MSRKSSDSPESAGFGGLRADPGAAGNPHPPRGHPLPPGDTRCPRRRPLLPAAGDVPAAP